MDTYQFIAALVSSLAWPLVVGILLFFLRNQLTSLAVRLKELTLPGGMKATFEKELEVGRAITELIPVEQVALPPPTELTENEKIRGVAIDAPAGAIILAYIEVERRLRDISAKLGLRYPNLQNTVKELIERGLLDSEASALFQSLKRARNNAAHGEISSLTTSDALEYARQASFLVGLLDAAASKL